MSQLIKTEAEIKILAAGGQKLAAILDSVSQAVRPGVTDTELEKLATKLINQAGGQPTFKDFQGYPAVSCISVNDEVVHGIPSGRTIKVGDLVGLDIGLRYQGFCTDAAITIGVGDIAIDKKKLLDVTKQSLAIGFEATRPGNHIGDIGAAIQMYVEGHGLGIVRDLTGHGIGRAPHEPPAIPNFGKAGAGPELLEGMVLAIEPMVTLGQPAVRQLADGWTIATVDGAPAAHFEHTVVVTKNGCQILTQ